MSNPWELVLDSIERHEDGLALMSLAEYRSEELAANGLSIAHMANPSAWTERGLAEAIADHMNRRFATADWSYRDFYGATRSLDASPDDVRRFIERCRSRGVAFGYLG